MQCYTQVGVRAKIKSIVYHPTLQFHQPIHIITVLTLMQFVTEVDFFALKNYIECV